nr:MAG TPA: hypothetical protein [Caudoviricetes sp.]
MTELVPTVTPPRFGGEGVFLCRKRVPNASQFSVIVGITDTIETIFSGHSITDTNER